MHTPLKIDRIEFQQLIHIHEHTYISFKRIHTHILAYVIYENHAPIKCIDDTSKYTLIII